MRKIQLDPTAAYDRIAPEVARISAQRRPCLTRIDQLIISEIPPGSRSLLDVGAGDGSRALHIAGQSELEAVTLLEPSAGMRRDWLAEVRTWAIPAEELNGKQDQFDVITCLWNVLRHVAPFETRAEVLRQFARLLGPQGLIFIDVSYRYNARHYGGGPTILRMIQDRIVPNKTSGDVLAHWDVDGTRYTTYGHVFTYSEFRALAHTASLTIKKMFSVDYATGRVHKSKFAGHLLYVLHLATEHPSDTLHSFS